MVLEATELSWDLQIWTAFRHLALKDARHTALKITRYQFASMRSNYLRAQYLPLQKKLSLPAL